MAEPHSSDDTTSHTHHVRVRLGPGALRRADATGLGEMLGALRLPGNTQVGDFVVLDAAGGRERFAVLRRAWVREADGMVLEITLDWPARG